MTDQELQTAIEKDLQNYYENDPEDRKQIALADHLGEDPEDLQLSSHTDHLYILGGSMRRSGSPPHIIANWPKRSERYSPRITT